LFVVVIISIEVKVSINTFEKISGSSETTSRQLGAYHAILSGKTGYQGYRVYPLYVALQTSSSPVEDQSESI
jgi:hypothetical protein